MGSYCDCALSWPLPELSIRGAGQKEPSFGDENVERAPCQFWLPICQWFENNDE